MFLFSACRSFEGSYSTLPDLFSNSIKFLSEDECVYYYTTDFGYWSMDYGKYKTSRGILTIEFEEIPEEYKYYPKSSSHEIIKLNSIKDSLKLEMEFFDSTDSTFLPFVEVYSLKSDTLVWIEGANNEGQLNAIFPKENLPMDFIAEFMHHKIPFTISETGNYKIDVFINYSMFPPPIYNSLKNDIIKFYIKKKTRSERRRMKANQSDFLYFEKIYETGNIPRIKMTLYKMETK